MQRNEIYIRKLRLPVYLSSLWIVVCPSIPKAIDLAEDQMNMKVAPPEVGSVRAYTAAVQKESGAKQFMLFLRPASKSGEVAHECKHLINLIFSWHGVNLSLTNDESECYYLEWVVDQAHNAIKQYKKIHIKPKKALYPITTSNPLPASSII